MRAAMKTPALTMAAMNEIVPLDEGNLDEPNIAVRLQNGQITTEAVPPIVTTSD